MESPGKDRSMNKSPEAARILAYLRHTEIEVREQVEGDDRDKQVRATDDHWSWSCRSLDDDAEDFDLCCRAVGRY